MSIRKIVYTYPPLFLRVLIRIPRILRLRFELLVQPPLESPLAAAIEALLALILVVHAVDVEFMTIEGYLRWQLAWFCGLAAGREMPGYLSTHLSPNFV